MKQCLLMRLFTFRSILESAGFMIYFRVVFDKMFWDSTVYFIVQSGVYPNVTVYDHSIMNLQYLHY